ncbi:sensor histidine kinase [Pararhodobacter oceanensis]|uniref:histidine kinase n=1 Tax=Pararhodobacter oceanensis TaxID=2172121 RepID=A0A2T8HRT5_9RHOB|nr:sensor histidine kinase [Pararhodobacter oceanensis]PVH28103.1 sodium:solute symporter [Pararhodobacter oceanensis]
MLSPDFVILTAVAYVGLLFVIAYFSDAQTRRGKAGFLRSPLVYTLSISVYCTSWTFYGAVGTAARDGLEFMAVYMGPTLVFVGWWFLLRKLVWVCHSQGITSIADLLSSRFGKSSSLAVLVTLIAMVTITPYIALQLKAIATSIQTVSSARGHGDRLAGLDDVSLALGAAVGMALFSIFFGTRNVDVREQHLGVVAAIAFEAAVKLLALIAVGLFVVFGMSGGFGDVYARAVEAGFDIHEREPFGSRWIAILILSSSAILCLPRQFHITVIENSNEEHLRTAGWAFPAYLLLMSTFTLPIAYYGLATMPAGSNPDMFVLTLPMAAGQDGLALFAFIGGFSSATSMIIIASIALSIMVSNHIVLPLALSRGDKLVETGEKGIARLLLRSRRISIAVILLMGFLYFWLTGESDALAPIGLISFAGVAQFLPALLAALYWRQAHVYGALSGILIGTATWAWTLFLPSFTSSSLTIASLVAHGPWGLTALRPEALFGMEGLDPLVHSVFWSLFFNVTALIFVSLLAKQNIMERVQSGVFVDIFRADQGAQTRVIRGSATTDEIFFVAERVLGWHRAQTLFEAANIPRGDHALDVAVSSEFIARLERELASSIGAASAHVLLTKVGADDRISLEEVMQIAGETQQAIEYSHELEEKSHKLRLTAQQLQEANARLHELHRQKDDFLSQVSHEVRTPMTSIRSISQILLRERDLDPDRRSRFIQTIHQESARLTRLLDGILDMSALEHGEGTWDIRPIDGETVLARAFIVCEALARQHAIAVEHHPQVPDAQILGDPDRLCQVFINIIANAIAHNDAKAPVVQVLSRVEGGKYVVDIADNGKGISAEYHSNIFDKFMRVQPSDAGAAVPSGLGLGLNISYTIIQKMNGRLELVDGPLEGACFRITLPLSEDEPA